MLRPDRSARDERRQDLLADVVARATYDAIRCSGWLDASIVAALARARRPIAVSVSSRRTFDGMFVRNAAVSSAG